MRPRNSRHTRKSSAPNICFDSREFLRCGSSEEQHLIHHQDITVCKKSDRQRNFSCWRGYRCIQSIYPLSTNFSLSTNQILARICSTIVRRKHSVVRVHEFNTYLKVLEIFHITNSVAIETSAKNPNHQILPSLSFIRITIVFIYQSMSVSINVVVFQY
jgi:hypothetical protein